jgi:large subunit ribosomal protein L4
MAEITVKTPAGEEVRRLQLDDAIFGVQPNVAVLHQVVTAQLASRRAGTHSTKTRAEVRGGGAKPYRQKGTGHARQGSTNSPQFSGGGIAHGPRPRSYGQRTPKKMIKLALRSALSDRAAEGKVVVVDDWAMSTPRTKDAAAALAALGLEGRVLVVVESLDTAIARSFRNLPFAQLIKSSELNAYDILCNDWIVFTERTLPTAADADAPAPTDAAVHPADPAEGAREEATDEPSGPPRAQEPAEGSPDVSQGTDGWAQDAVSEGLRTAEGSASDEAESSEPEASETEDTDLSQGTDGWARAAVSDGTGTGEGSASDEPESDEEERSDDEEDRS